MASVFISYAREDGPKARAIARALEKESFDVWIDQRIGSGSEFSREIEEALKSASAVVVLWSTNSVDSPWVRDEAAEGRDSGRLVPVLLEECRPPLGFRQFQTTDLSRWSGRGRPKQIDDVIAAVSAKAGAPLKASAERPPAVKCWWASPRGWAAAAVAVVALVAVAVALFVGRPNSQPTRALSVALLPFTADAADTDARKISAAARDAVAHTLSQGPFSVRTIDSAPQGAAAPADFLISGQATSAPDKFTVTVRMEETEHHVIVFSHQFETTRADVGDFAEMIGAQVASQLSWTAPLIAMERRHPSDPAIITALLQSSVAGLDSVGTLHDYETSRRLAGQAPNSPLAQNSFAFNTAFALYEILPANRGEAVAAARRAADRTLELAPEYSGAYIPWCLLHSEQRMAECENRLRAGMRADADDTFANWFLSRLLNNVGRNAEAVQLASLSLAHDQYMPYKIAHMLRTLEVTGRNEEADDLYRQSRRWWPKEDVLFWNRIIGFLERGDFEAEERVAHQAQKNNSQPMSVMPLASAVKARSVDGVRAICTNPNIEEIDGTACMLALARVGDLAGAYGLADRLFPSRRGRTPADEERIWLQRPNPWPLGFLTGPGAAPMRRDARYLALAQRVGLIEYWRSGRPPDFCTQPKPEPICPALLKG